MLEFLVNRDLSNVAIRVVPKIEYDVGIEIDYVTLIPQDK
jgi:hypothetical protein